jgi:hypothetical protein
MQFVTRSSVPKQPVWFNEIAAYSGLNRENGLLVRTFAAIKGTKTATTST